MRVSRNTLKDRERRLYNLFIIHVRGPLHTNTSKSSLTRNILTLLHSPQDPPRSSNTFVLDRPGRILTREPPLETLEIYFRNSSTVGTGFRIVVRRIHIHISCHSENSVYHTTKKIRDVLLLLSLNTFAHAQTTFQDSTRLLW